MSNILKFKNSVESPFKITCAAENTKAEIIIYGSIGDDFWDDAAVSAKKFSDELGKLPKSVKEITLRLNSPGGSVFDGMAIYERLKQHSAKKIVMVDGIAASIASIIAMAGDEIILGEGSFFMIHKPWSATIGNSTNHEETINILNNIEHQMIGIYSKKTGLNRAEIQDMLAKDTWMNADVSLSKGFATKINNSSENLRVAASMVSSAKWLAKTNPPKLSDSKLVKARLEEIKNKVDGLITRKPNAVPKK